MCQRAALLHLMLTACLTTVTIGGVAAGPLEDAREAYRQGDYATAYQLFRPLADKGNSAAQTNLGVMYGSGQGLPQSYAEALKWFRKAGDQGNAAAQFNLGLMYRMGQGVPRNCVLAYMWFNLAASQFPASKKDSRDGAIKARDSCAANMTLAQITKAQKLAHEWKPKPETAQPEATPEWWQRVFGSFP